MAKSRKRPVPPQSPQGVFPANAPPSIAYAIGRAQAATKAHYEAEFHRQKERLDLTERLRELRTYLKGYEGPTWDLRHLSKWSPKKKEKLLEQSKRLRSFTARPHVSVSVPKNRSRVRALRTLTNQSAQKMKKFLVYTEDPKRTEILFDDKNKITVRVKYPGGKWDRKFFLYRDYAKRDPVTFPQQQKVLKRMLPSMPEGKYGLWSLRGGIIGMPQSKEFLFKMLDEYHMAYEEPSPEALAHEGFGAVIAGFVYMGRQTNVVRWKNRQAREKKKRDRGIKFFKDARQRNAERIAKRKAMARYRAKLKMAAPKKKRKAKKKARKHK